MQCVKQTISHYNIAHSNGEIKASELFRRQLKDSQILNIAKALSRAVEMNLVFLFDIAVKFIDQLRRTPFFNESLCTPGTHGTHGRP